QFLGAPSAFHPARSLPLAPRRWLPAYPGQLRADLLAANLGIARGGLDRRRAFLGHVPQRIGDLLQTPAECARPVGEIMPQIMVRKVRDEIPLRFRPAPLQGAEPVVNAGFTQTVLALRGEDELSMDASRCRLHPIVFQVLSEGMPRVVDQVDVARLPPL